MRRFLIVPLLVLLKFTFFSFFGSFWFLFDPLLALVVIYTFFHSMDMRDYLSYALFCGLWQDIFSLDLFGIHMFSYLVDDIKAIARESFSLIANQGCFCVAGACTHDRNCGL